MSSTALDMAFNDGVLNGAYFTVVYFLVGAILAVVRWHIWQRHGDTIWKTLIAPLASLEKDVPYIREEGRYVVSVAAIWPATVIWNILTLFATATFCIGMGLGSLGDKTWDLMKRGARAGYHHVLRPAYHFLRATPEKRAQRKILWLERRRKRLRDESSRCQYRLRGEIARNRIRLTALDRQIDDLNDSLPEPAGEPYRSARLRAVC